MQRRFRGLEAACRFLGIAYFSFESLYAHARYRHSPVHRHGADRGHLAATLRRRRAGHWRQRFGHWRSIWSARLCQRIDAHHGDSRHIVFRHQPDAHLYDVGRAATVVHFGACDTWRPDGARRSRRSTGFTVGSRTCGCTACCRAADPSERAAGPIVRFVIRNFARCIERGATHLRFPKKIASSR